MAIRDFNRGIRRQPGNAAAFGGRALAYQSIGQNGAANTDFDYLYRLISKDANILNRWAHYMATDKNKNFRNGRQAVRFAEKAISISDDATYRDTLAAAHAEAGDFPAAVREQERAIKLLLSQDHQDKVAVFEARLKLYRQGRPFRE